MSKYNRLTEEQKATIIQMHLDGFTTVDIERVIGKDNSSIGLFLKKNGYQPSGQKKRITKDIVSQMKTLYLEGWSSIAIGQQFNLSDRTVVDRLRKAGVDIRGSGRQLKPRRYDYFKNIDDEKKAYFLGLILADGCIIEHASRPGRNPSVSLSLNEEDSYLLQEFAKAIEDNDIAISGCKGRKTKEYRITSREMVDDLAVYGIVPRKSLIAKFPHINRKLERHLIRGFFDGNGTVYFRGNKLVFGFYGTHDLLTSIKTSLVNEFGISDNKVFDKPTVSMMSFSKKRDIINFYRYLYDDATIFMKRKRQKFDVFINANSEVSENITRHRNA